MKKYTFNLNNTTKTINPSNTSNNYSEILDNIISANIKKANPYFYDLKPDFGTLTTSTPKKQIDIDITIGQRKPNIEYTFDCNSYSDLFEAIDFIRKTKQERPFYDYKLADGTPIKFFGDELQIGFDLIPLKDFSQSYFKTLSPDTRKHIIDITIDIKRAA